ncbi:MAG: hypothetical protein HFJ45_02570 [Clostridia bacterium]|nr:hypothetical protein [Clostridia bacterium]
MKYSIGDMVELIDGTITTIKDIKITSSEIVYGVGESLIIAKTDKDIIRKIN